MCRHTCPCAQIHMSYVRTHIYRGSVLGPEGNQQALALSRIHACFGLKLKSLGGKPLSLLSRLLPSLTHIKTKYTQQTVSESEDWQVTGSLSRETLRHHPCFQSRCAPTSGDAITNPGEKHPKEVRVGSNTACRVGEQAGYGALITFVPGQEAKQGQEV